MDGVNAPPFLGLRSVGLELRPYSQSPEKAELMWPWVGTSYPESNELDCLNKCTGPLSEL